jgi:hypothetical protein
MAQNVSSAVMQQRIEPNDSFDDFPTPCWATRALIEQFIKPRWGLSHANVWEPCCNRGFMARPLMEYFGSDTVFCTDIFDYGWKGMHAREDFLFPGAHPPMQVHWTIANPPFRLAEEFIKRAVNISEVGCAMLVRTSFLEGVGRFEGLYRNMPPTIVAQFVERLPMVKGRCDPKASTATSYAWLIWARNAEREPMRWVEPCRKKLERASDYAY